MTAKMQAALRILQMTNLDLSAHLAEQALENPCLEVTMPDAAPPLPTGVAGGARAQDWDEIAALESGKPSLYAHVADQIALAFPDDGPRRVAMVFVEALEPTGWLGTPVEAVAASARVAVPVAEAVLTRLHQLEPAGLFARSLAECLKLQAEDKGLLTWELSVILDNLALIAEGRIDDLAEMCDGTPADVRAALAAIRGLDPKPGLAFAAAEAPILPPDLRVVRRADGWTVEVNRGSLPSLRIREGALTWADAEALAYMRRARSSARWLKRAIERRQATLLATAAVLVRHQAAFLDGGPRHLRPLTAEAVAEELELHPSTISRAVADRLIETPRGTLPLRVFFSRAVAPGNAEGPSQDAAMALVGDIVAGEDRSKPLSDAAIVKKATAAGVPLARRTVAKYRDLLGIPSSYDRRQAAALTA